MGNSPTTGEFPSQKPVTRKWKHFPRHWPFVWEIYRPPVNSSHRSQWRGASVFSLMCSSTNGGVKNRDAGDLRRHYARYYVTVMFDVYIKAWVKLLPFSRRHLKCILNEKNIYVVSNFIMKFVSEIIIANESNNCQWVDIGSTESPVPSG